MNEINKNKVDDIKLPSVPKEQISNNNNNEPNKVNNKENKKEEQQENASENKIWNGLDLNALSDDKLKEELYNRKIEFPKDAKKKELQDLLIKSNTK